MTPRPASARWPGLRSGLYGLVTALTPLVWVFEVDSCGGSAPRQSELTGLQLAARVDGEAWAVLAPVLLVAVAAPFFAGRVSAGWALLAQVAGLAATGFVAWWLGFLLSFALFKERVLRPAGAVVAAAAVATVVEALARAALSGRAWWRARAR